MGLILKGSDSVVFRASATEKGWHKAKHAFELLHDPLVNDGTKFTPLYPKHTKQAIQTKEWGITQSAHPPSYCVFVEPPMVPEIWETLPLQDHRVIRPLPEDKAFFRQAFDYLASTHPELSTQTHDFLHVIVLVDILSTPGPQTGRCLTSVSIPDLPFCSFFSRKAFLHIPPEILSPTPDVRFLAENLCHEAIHHRVSLTLLENDILQPEYHSRLSPKVAIPWRQKDRGAVSFWELDRVLHAFSVYVGLLPYRQKEAARERQEQLSHLIAPPPSTNRSPTDTHPHDASPSKTSPRLRQGTPQLSPGVWGHAFSQARVCAHFLGQTMFNHRNVLTPLGYRYVCEQWSILQSYFPETGVFFENMRSEKEEKM